MKRTCCILFAILSAAGLFGDDGKAKLKEITAEELAVLVRSRSGGYFLVDVRTPAEFASGAIPTAINIPVDEIEKNPPTQDRAARIIVYCRSGARSGRAKSILESLGYSDVTNFGGVSRWPYELIKR